MLDLTNRILLNRGTSVVNDNYAVKLLLRDGKIPDHIKVIKSKDSEMYKEKYGIDIDSDGEEKDISPDTHYSDVDFLNIVVGISTPRDNIDDESHYERLEKELGYFNNSNLNYIIVKMYYLIKQFKEDGVVWGVGRGSSCACYIFYLMGVHDINPIKFGIPFSEFSKEEE